MKNSLFFLIFALCRLTSTAQTILANSNWVVTVPTSTITEAGNDYTTGIVSASNQTLLTFSLPKQGNFEVFIHKIDADWDSRLTFWALRTGAGIGSPSGNLTGHNTVFQVNSSPQSFMKGGTGHSTTWSNIPIQYEIRGLSVLIPVKIYTTTVVFTISD